MVRTNSRRPFQGGACQIESRRKMIKSGGDQLSVSILGRCRPHRDSNKNTKAWYSPTLRVHQGGACLIESQRKILKSGGNQL